MPQTLRNQGSFLEDTPWGGALRVAIYNAGLFTALSTLFYAAGIQNSYATSASELIFFAGSLYAFGGLLRSGGELAAISFFVLASGFYFGFGTFFSTVISSTWMDLLFTQDDQLRLLNKLNLLNGLSTLIAVTTAAVVCGRARPSSGQGANASNAAKNDGLEQFTSLFVALRVPMLLLAVPSVMVLLLTFPVSDDAFFLSSVVRAIQGLTSAALLLCGLQWSALSRSERIMASVLLVVLISYGLAMLSKTYVFMPAGALLAGWLLDTRGSRKLFFWGVAIFAIVAAPVGALCNTARIFPGARPDNTLSERVQILEDVMSTGIDATQTVGLDVILGGTALLDRFGDAPIQAFLIQQYEIGKPGASLDEAFTALVPRFLWPNKPEISRQGRELDALFKNFVLNSFLAPTYTGEAFWNGGWLTSLLVAFFIGAQVGWFSEKWRLFRRDGVAHLGIMIFSVPVVLNYLLVESWIVLQYVGGFVSMFVAVSIGDFVGPFISRYLERRASSRRPPIAAAAPNP